LPPARDESLAVEALKDDIAAGERLFLEKPDVIPRRSETDEGIYFFRYKSAKSRYCCQS
jgi:hypothetical protein